MADRTNIEWADASWSPWHGCTKVDPGCVNCYAEALARRMGLDVFGAGKPRRRHSPDYWRKPLKWNDEVVTDPPGMIPGSPGVRYYPPSVFPSLCDPFDADVPIEWFADFLTLIHDTPNLRWLLLTKRPRAWQERIACAWMDAPMRGDVYFWVKQWDRGHPPANVAVGVSAGTQDAWDARVPWLLEIPAAMKFVSAEPLLGPIDPQFQAFTGNATEARPCGGREVVGNPTTVRYGPMPDWVIIGGESGPRRREMDLQWMRRLADDCFDAAIPVFIKQDSKLHPGQQGRIPTALWTVKQKPAWLQPEGVAR